MLHKSLLTAALCLVVCLFFSPPGEEARASGYVVPSYYFNGSYYYHPAGYFNQVWYPAGYYAWIGGAWVLQGGNVTVNNNNVTYTKDWKSQLLGVAKDRVDNQAFIEAARALGLNPLPASSSSYAVPGYGSNSYLRSLNLSSYGANANTLFGYSYNTIKDVYGDTNLNALYQQAARLAENSQTLAGQATSGFQDLVGNQADNLSRVAEILAKAQAAERALNAANPQPRTTVSSTTSGSAVGSATVVGPQQPGPANPAINAAWAQLAANKCASCHSSKTQGGPKGKFDIAAYPTLATAQKLKVWERLTTSDAARRMPQAEGGKPGTPLAAEEVKLFVDN